MASAVELLLARKHRVVARVETRVDLDGIPAEMSCLDILEISEEVPHTRALSLRADAALRGLRNTRELAQIDADWR